MRRRRGAFLYFDIDCNARLEFHCEVILIDSKLLDEPFDQCLIKLCDDGSKLPIMAMGPICIAPKYKRKGYGKILLDYSLQKAKEYGCKALCSEGNIDFYGKSGFTYARDFGIRYHGLPDGADSSFFLCKELEVGYLDGVTGEYTPPRLYMVDEQEAEEFDKTFEFKQKLVLPEQMF